MLLLAWHSKKKKKKAACGCMLENFRCNALERVVEGEGVEGERVFGEDSLIE